MDALLLAKARRYCAAQERCISEVRLKLLQWGADEKTANAIIKRVVKDDFLNEHRFAEHYAVSKFRQKGWGRLKIRAALAAKDLSEENIDQGSAAIDPGEY